MSEDKVWEKAKAWYEEIAEIDFESAFLLGVITKEQIIEAYLERMAN